ncbi:MAG TPA: 50S ribosomal protein L4 [Sutterella sp.]|nr:50S ribosomal protein L4 [Sutterella sp.]
MELHVLNEQGQDAGTMTVSDAVFGREFNEALIHQIVVAYRANGRFGTRSQLTRAEVHHSTKKPWRQKGTGRARSGMTSSPVWRGGGRTFPNKPFENFSQKVNKKMYRAAMASICSKLVADGRLVVLESVTAETPKTREFAKKLKTLGLDDALIVVKNYEENVLLASGNIKNVFVLEPRELNPYDLIAYKKVVVAKDAIADLEEMWG